MFFCGTNNLPFTYAWRRWRRYLKEYGIRYSTIRHLRYCRISWEFLSFIRPIGFDPAKYKVGAMCTVSPLTYRSTWSAHVWVVTSSRHRKPKSEAGAQCPYSSWMQYLWLGPGFQPQYSVCPWFSVLHHTSVCYRYPWYPWCPIFDGLDMTTHPLQAGSLSSHPILFSVCSLGLPKLMAEPVYCVDTPFESAVDWTSTEESYTMSASVASYK